jgi:large subunit ribosomal protein L4
MAALNAPVLGATTKAKLDPATFGLERNDSLVHEVVKAELAARRQGTHATKTRGMVSGGGAKPWRQKGTGRARAGTTRAPQWTGGGVVFGPSPRNYTGKVNRKAYHKAMQIALSAHAAGGTLAAIDGAAFKAPKTSQAAELVADFHVRGPMVVVVTSEEDAVARSFRNLDRAHVIDVGSLEVADLVWARRVAVSKAALQQLEGRNA